MKTWTVMIVFALFSNISLAGGDEFIDSIYSKDLHTVKIALKELPAYNRDIQLRWGLKYSIANSTTEIVQTLIEAGAPINERFAYSYPLEVAIDEHNLGMLQLLVDAGADLERSSSRVSILSYALDSGDFKSVKILLRGGADIFDVHWLRPTLEGFFKKYEQNGDSVVAKLFDPPSDIVEHAERECMPTLDSFDRRVARTLLRYKATQKCIRASIAKKIIPDEGNYEL